jgi:hypothetical protein
VQCGSLAQGAAQKAAGIAPRALCLAGKQICLNINGDLRKTVQVRYLDPCH